MATDEHIGLALEQIHDDLLETRNLFRDLPAILAKNLIKELTINVTNEKFDGKVEVENELVASLSNINEVTSLLDKVIASVDRSKADSVSIDGVVEVKDLQKIIELIQKISEKKIVVKSPDVIVNNPDTIEISNLPTTPDKPIAVRLSDGKQFMSELVRVISSGGGSRSPYNRYDTTEAALVTLREDGSIPVGSMNKLVSENHDDIQVAYPTTTTEVFSYYLDAVKVAEVTVTYEDATKAKLLRVQRT